jgi:hypothetical protein
MASSLAGGSDEVPMLRFTPHSALVSFDSYDEVLILRFTLSSVPSTFCSFRSSTFCPFVRP